MLLDILFENWLRLRLQRFSPRTSKIIGGRFGCAFAAALQKRQAQLAVSKPKRKKYTQTCEDGYLLNNNL